MSAKDRGGSTSRAPRTNLGMVASQNGHQTQPAPPKALSVPASLQAQADAMVALQTSVENLASRLAPVLSQSPTEGDHGVAQSDCLIATTVSQHTAAVWRAISVLDQLTANLEV